MSQQDIYSEIERLNAIDSSYDRRREMEAMSADQLFTANLVIEKIERSYGYIREDGFRDGRTVVGKLVNSDQEIKLSLPQALNERADTWKEGETIAVNVNLHDYDTAYKRYHVLGRSIESRVPTDTDTTEPENRENQDTQLESITSEVETSDAAEMQRVETQTEELPERIVEPETEPEPVSASELKQDQDEQEFQEAAPVEQQPVDDFDLDESALHLPAALPVITAEPDPPTTHPKPKKTRTKKTGKGKAKRKLKKLAPIPTANTDSHHSDSLETPQTRATHASGKPRRRTPTKPGKTSARKSTESNIGIRIIKIFVAAVIIATTIILLSVTVFESITTSSTRPKKSTLAHKPSSVIWVKNNAPDGEIGTIPTDHGHGGTPARYIWSHNKGNFLKPFYSLETNSEERSADAVIMHPTEPIVFVDDGVTLTARNIESGINVDTPDQTNFNTKSISFSEDGAHCMLLMSDDQRTYKGLIFKWPLTSNLNPIVTFPVSDVVSDAFFGPNDRSIITVDSSKESFLHKTGKIIELPSQTELTEGVKISHSRPTFLAGDFNIVGIGSLYTDLVGHSDDELFSYSSNPMIFKFKLAASSRYSDLIAAINIDRQIRIFRPPIYRVIWTLKGFRKTAKHLDMSHLGTHIVVLEDHKNPELLIINIHTAEVTARLHNPAAQHLHWCEFSPDSKYVYALNSDNEIVFWRIQSDWIKYTPTESYTPPSRF